MNLSMYRYRSAGRTRLVMTVVSICFAVVCGFTALTIPLSVPVSAAGKGDAARGKDLFEKRCGGCHALDADKEGPRLRNVYGRKAGSITTFKYSDALKSANITWDAASLDKWLIDTESVIHDNDMDFHVPKEDERADIIEYLRASAGK